MTVLDPTSPHDAPTLAAQLDGPLGTFTEHRILPGWIRAQRWFRSKSRSLRAVTFESVFPCDATGAGEAVFATVRIDFDADESAQDPDDTRERYLLPLALVPEENASTLPDIVLLGPVMTPAGTRMLIDGCWHDGFRTALFSLLSRNEKLSGAGGRLRGHPTSGSLSRQPGVTSSRVLSAEQSNTSLVYGRGADAVFVKLYRRIEEGIHPEPEMLRFLSERTTFRNAPGFLSSLRWVDMNGRERTVALAQEFWENAADAWEDMLNGLRNAPVEDGVPDRLRATASLLGARVGAFHRAAASCADDADFAPETFTPADAEDARARARASLAAGLLEVARRLDAQDGDRAREPGFPVAEARTLLTDRVRLEARLDAAVQALQAHAEDATGTLGLRIRTHGDLHLGQILILPGAGGQRDAGLLDFEGEPGRPLAAARRKHAPLRDVAGMLRSFHYVAHAAVRDEANTPDARTALDPERASATLCDAFLDAYFNAVTKRNERDDAAHATPVLLPASDQARRALLDVFVLEKAAYELAYECDNRPDWAAIPIRGLLALRDAGTYASHEM